MASQPKIPTYKPDVRAGYDPARKRYYLKDGTQVSKRGFLQHLREPAGDPDSERFGFFLQRDDYSEARAWTKLENLVASGERGRDLTSDPDLQKAGERFNFIAGFVEPDRLPPAAKAEPIPTAMRSAYNLVDYYYDRAGDVAQHVEAPIDVALNDINIQGEWEKELAAYYDRDKLHMRHVLFQAMYSAAKYGVAYPFEVYQEKDPRAVVFLPPRYMWVGYHATQATLLSLATAQTPDVNYHQLDKSAYALRPVDNSAAWSAELLRTLVQPIAYGPMADKWNDQVPARTEVWGLPIPLQYLDPIRAKSMDYERYAMPPIARAFSNLSTRGIFHEMRRAVLEGHKNQLWFFVLGEKDRPPSPEEMAAFKSAINGMTGHRTGNLVWRYGADAKVIAPEAIQGMLANETSVLFDLAIYRDLGGNIRLVSGNPAGITGSGGGEGLEIDLSLWLRRLEFIRRQVLDWEYGYRLRLAKRVGGEKAVKAAKATQVTFSQSLLEVGEIVKREVQPMYMAGLYSPQTALARVGGSYEIELANKKKFQPDMQHFMPMPTYNQTATGMGGQATTSATAPQGRPAANVSPAKLRASWGQDYLHLQHVTDVLIAYADFVKTGDAAAFVQSLGVYNGRYLAEATDRGYRNAGGVWQLDDEVLGVATNFVNAFLPGFQHALETADARDDAKLIARALLYPAEGYKMAILNGQNRAMRERGASHWKRIVKAGGCPDCTADAQLAHPIDEPFLVLHPNENCAGQEQYIQYLIGGLPSVEIAVPGSRGEYADLVAKILGGSGERSRRRRNG